jgi:crotonobetainyl-CoA:carnitine CoA-transferase CaiB-like acyl-CoA transferase
MTKLVEFLEPGGPDVLRIVETVDVFIEAFRPGVAQRLGVGYEAVRARNPRVVYCSITAFGQTGPYRDIPAHDLACEAYAGITSVSLGMDDQPTLPPVPVADFSAASMALAGILMALYRREKTGAGDCLDIAMYDCALSWLPNVTGPVFVEKRNPIPKHERSWGGGAFYRIYRTRDGRHVVLGAQEIKFVRSLLTQWGRPDLIELCERGPGPHQKPVVDFLQGVFATRTQAEWVEWFRPQDIGFAPVRTMREAFSDEQTIAREMRLLDELGQEHIGLPIKFANEPGHANFRLPEPGEHTQEILARCRR